jgi:hypothetical protein
MKKLIFIFLILFFLTGCNNSVEFDFNEDIDANINLSFTLDEYKKYSDLEDEDELKSSIDAIRDDREAFVVGNHELFEEKSFINNNNYYNASYEYTYTYANFANNSVLNICFEYFGTKEDEKTIYLSLKGKSMCAPFKLIVKADNRIINSNENIKQGNEYIWNIQELNNDIYIAISKTEIVSSSFNVLNLIYVITAIVIGVVTFILNKKFRESK